MAKILVLTPRFPYPIVAGDTLRIHHICKELSRQHSLTLLSMLRSDEKIERSAALDVFDRIECVHHPLWRSFLGTVRALFSNRPLQLGYYFSNAFRRRVDDLIATHDLALAHLVRTGQYLEDHSPTPAVLEMTDALSLNYQRVIETNMWGWKNLIYRIEQPRMQRYEKQTIRNFDLVSLVSGVDRKVLLEDRSDGDNHVAVYKNGIDLAARPYTPPNPDHPPVLVFIGNMRTVHNRDTCHYFAEEVLPKIRTQLPGTTFRIIGAAEKKTIASLENYEGVEVTGWVDSISNAAKGALCGIGVMRLGAGLQNKILEYMALGLPVIANDRGLEGIEAEHNRHVLLGDTAEQIANHVLRLVGDPDEQVRFARAGRRFVEENHEWGKTLRPLVEKINTLL